MDAQVDIKTEDIIPSTDLKPSLPKSKKKMESEKPKEVEKELN